MEDMEFSMWRICRMLVVEAWCMLGILVRDV